MEKCLGLQNISLAHPDIRSVKDTEVAFDHGTIHVETGEHSFTVVRGSNATLKDLLVELDKHVARTREDRVFFERYGATHRRFGVPVIRVFMGS